MEGFVPYDKGGLLSTIHQVGVVVGMEYLVNGTLIPCTPSSCKVANTNETIHCCISLVRQNFLGVVIYLFFGEACYICA